MCAATKIVTFSLFFKCVKIEIYSFKIRNACKNFARKSHSWMHFIFLYLRFYNYRCLIYFILFSLLIYLRVYMILGMALRGVVRQRATAFALLVRRLGSSSFASYRIRFNWRASYLFFFFFLKLGKFRVFRSICSKFSGLLASYYLLRQRLYEVVFPVFFRFSEFCD